MLFIAIDDVQKGRDPEHIIRDPVKNEIIYIMEEEYRLGLTVSSLTFVTPGR